MKRKLPKSIRKYIRKEKARLRLKNTDFSKQKELIDQLYQRFLKKNEDTGNLQLINRKRD